MHTMACGSSAGIKVMNQDSLGASGRCAEIASAHSLAANCTAKISESPAVSPAMRFDEECIGPQR